MADNLDLLFRIRGDATGAKNATEQARQAVHQLRTSTTSDLRHIQQSSTRSFSAISESITQVGGQIPIVGGAINTLSSSLGTMTVASKGAAAGMAGLAGPLGLAAVGIGLTASAAGTLGAELFALAKSSADAQDKLDDLSQQTGVNVETLSALEILVKSSGGSIDNLAQSLVVFQGKLDEAQDSTSKAGKQFKELGISTASTETALRDALNVLAKMPEGFHQTNTAAELFGRRGARQFLGVLKEAHGDLDGAIKRLKELGLIISDADAKAASDFNKQLDLLNFQLRAVGITIGKEIVPVALAAIKDLSQALKDNKDAINAVATAAGLLSNLFTGPLKGAIILVEEQWRKIHPVLVATAEVYERIAEAVRFLQGKTNFGAATPGAVGAGLGDFPEFGADAAFKLPGLKSGLFKKALEESDAQARQELELQRHLTEDLKLEHEKRAEDLERFYDRQQILVDEHYATLTGQIARERGAVLAAFQRGEIDQAEANKRSVDLDLRATQAKNKNDEDTRRLTLEKDRALVQQELELRQGLASIEAARREGELARLEAALERQAAAESEVLTRRLDFLKANHKERIGIIDFEIKAESTSATRKAELNNEKAILEQRYTDEFKRLTQERMDALAAEAAAGHPGIAGTAPGGIGEDALAKIAGAAADAAVPPLKEFTELTPQVIAGIDSMRDAFGALGQAVGQAVHAFVLFGSAGTSLRKFTAEVLAAVAAQAAVKAVFELAEGFAMLALTYFTGNPKYAASAGAHFVAAGMYGAIAGVAAVAGRAVAGNEFTKGAGGGSGGDSGQGTGQLNPLTLNRNQPPPIVIHVDVKHEEGTIVKTWADNYRSGGVTRELTREDG